MLLEDPEGPPLEILPNGDVRTVDGAKQRHEDGFSLEQLRTMPGPTGTY